MEEEKLELERIYKELYLTIDNSEKCIDYESLIRIYMLYLSLFLDKSSDFYGDCQFLFYVVDGFYYVNKLAFDDIDFSEEEMVEGTIKHEMDLRTRVGEAIENELEDENYSDSDVVLCYSLEIYSFFQMMNLVEDYAANLRFLAVNTYLIEEKMNEKLQGCEENGMEYWKHHN